MDVAGNSTFTKAADGKPQAAFLLPSTCGCKAAHRCGCSTDYTADAVGKQHL